MKMLILTLVCALALLTFPVAAQDIPVDSEVVHPNKRVTVSDLAMVTARDTSGAAVAKAALAIVLGASRTKCDRGSQLNVVDANAGPSLRSLASKLSGAPCSMNGRMLRLTASFTANGEIRAEALIAPLVQGQPLLFKWKNTLYVLYGVVYDEHLFYSGRRDNVIRELLLIDPRYSDKRRLVAFEREQDDFAEVEGVASVSVGQ